VLGGDFPEPEPRDIRRAARLVEIASALTGMVVLASLMVRS
jgi:cobalamin biosynthesis protein CobD/CbiB